MKKSIRLIALFLALVMCVGILASCDSGDETTAGTVKPSEEESTPSGTGSGDSETETVEEIAAPDIDKKNYGSDFFILIQQDVNKMDYHWVEKSDGDVMSEAIFARQEKVRQHLGVTITGIEAGEHTTYTEAFKTDIKNKGGQYQMIMTHVHSGIASLIQGGFLQDLNKVEGIDLEADYWTHEINENLALNDRVYLGNSRFNILYTHVIAFNKTMMEQYEDSMGTTVYDLVDNYEWTLDQMIALAERVSIDATGDGKTVDDTYGLVGVQWVPFVGLLQASNINLVEADESGMHKVSVYNDINQQKTSALVDKLGALVKSSNAWFKYRVEETPTIPLHSGRALMSLESTNGLESLSEYDIKFGVLPYPMFDEAQRDVGYRHLQWGGFLGVPAYLENPTMVGETIEMLSYYSVEVGTAFYQKLLGKQAAAAPKDRKILDLVWDTICSDFGQAYSEVGGSMLYMLPELTNPNGTLQLASYIKGKEATINKGIKKFLTTLDKMSQ